MATGSEWSCPICREASADIAYVGSCLHQFCRGCIVRWARLNPSCPLCRQTVHTIIYPTAPSQGLAETAVPQPSTPRRTTPREGPQRQAQVAGFPPETWAALFRNHGEVLRPLERWLNEVLCGDCWWDVAFAQGRIVASLCRFGLHEEALARELRPLLAGQTAAFVRHLLDVAAEQCGELARRHFNAAPQQAGHAIAFPGASGVLEERREGPRQAGGGAPGSCGPGVSWQSGRRRGGGSEESGAAHRKPYRRQN